MLAIPFTTVAVFLGAFAVTLVLASWFTPRRWWRQANACALGVLVLGTWGLASLALWLLPPHDRAAIAQGVRSPALALAPAVPAAAPVARQQARYRVHQDLNLRVAGGTGAARIAVVPAGTVVTTTGLRDGDWWQVSAQVAGHRVQGWSSSLWLRRADEI